MHHAIEMQFHIAKCLIIDVKACVWCLSGWLNEYSDNGEHSRW